jgi:small subunit ribosomal protein S4
MELLERRLDNAVFRAGFAVSRGIARKLVSHGHILVNGKRVNIPSYCVRPGEEVAIHKKSLESPMFAELANRLKKYESPSWMELDREGRRAKIGGIPKGRELGSQRNLRLVVEYYSKL